LRCNDRTYSGGAWSATRSRSIKQQAQVDWVLRLHKFNRLVGSCVFINLTEIQDVLISISKGVFTPRMSRSGLDSNLRQALRSTCQAASSSCSLPLSSRPAWAESLSTKLNCCLCCWLMA
jgi:hypothetical protein